MLRPFAFLDAKVNGAHRVDGAEDVRYRAEAIGREAAFKHVAVVAGGFPWRSPKMYARHSATARGDSKRGRQ